MLNSTSFYLYLGVLRHILKFGPRSTYTRQKKNCFLISACLSHAAYTRYAKFFMIQTDELFRLSLNLRYITHLVSNILCCDVKNSSWELPINIYVHKFPKIQSLWFEGLSVTGMFSSGFPSKSFSKLPLKNWLWKNTFPFSVFLTKKGHVVKFNWYCKSHGCVTHLENDSEKICVFLLHWIHNGKNWWLRLSLRSGISWVHKTL